MKRLSIIMSYLNEGEQPLRTIESIHETSDSSAIEIIAVDDGSESAPLDFSAFPAVKAIRHPIRQGVPKSLYEAIDATTTSNILRIDGHMRFQNDGWLNRLVDAIEREPETIFCTTCVKLWSDQLEMKKAEIKHYGADLNILASPDLESMGRHILEPSWRPEESGNEYEIPCVLGANYLFKKEWFLYIKALHGLRHWGGEEVSMSLKTWMAGGSVKIIKDVEIGHIFRKKSPYMTEKIHLILNKLWMAWSLFPDDFARKLVLELPNTPLKRTAEVLLHKRVNELEAMKAYHRDIFKHSIYELADRFELELPKGLVNLR